jgi:hypothetical protein
MVTLEPTYEHTTQRNVGGGVDKYIDFQNNLE